MLPIDLNLPKTVDMTLVPAAKVVTYQCLCKVKGKLRFALYGPSDTVLDELVVESPKDDGGDYVYGDTMLVTLRHQVLKYVFEVEAAATVRIENPLTGEGFSGRMQCFWQQAWGDGWPE